MHLKIQKTILLLGQSKKNKTKRKHNQNWKTSSQAEFRQDKIQNCFDANLENSLNLEGALHTMEGGKARQKTQ